LLPRYLVKNRTDIVANVAGFVTEYRPVYSRQLQVYKGIDNVLEFRLLNADQKPIDISTYTPRFVAFDENKNLIIEHDGVSLQTSDSTVITNKGLFSITVTENDLLNIKQQYLNYNIYLVDANSQKVLTYAHTNFDNDAIIYVSAQAFPGPQATYSTSYFTQTNVSDVTWVSEAIDAQPGINGNEALHTAVVYTNGYVGDVVVQSTLENEIAVGTNWADIATITLNGSETEPTPVNFNGVISFLRFQASADPADKITKILVRN